MREIELLGIVDDLYRAALEPDAWAGALHKLARSVGGAGSVMLPIRGAGDLMAISPDMHEASEIYVRDGWWQYDSLTAYAARNRMETGVWTDRELYTDAQRARDPFYQEFRRGAGVDGMICTLVTPVPGITMSVAVQLPIGHELDEDQRRVFSALSTHAVRAVSTAMHAGLIAGIQRGLAAALSEIGCAAAVLDASNRLVLSNPAFERLQPEAFTLQQGELRAAAREQQVAVDRLVAFARHPLLGDVSGDVVLLRRKSGRRPVLLRAVPVDPDLLERGSGGDHGHVLLLAVDLESGDDGKEPASVLRLLGLTGAESRIAAMVGQGVSPKETADLLGIAESTVRVTLKRVFSKLEIGRQSDLVLLVDRISRGLRSRRP